MPFHSQLQVIASHHLPSQTSPPALRFAPRSPTTGRRNEQPLSSAHHPRHTNNVTRTTTSNTHHLSKSTFDLLPIYHLLLTMCLPNPFSKSFHRRHQTPRDEKHAHRDIERQTNGLLAIALKSKQNDSVNSFTARDPAVFYQRREDHEDWARHEGGGKRLVRGSLFERLRV